MTYMESNESIMATIQRSIAFVNKEDNTPLDKENVIGSLIRQAYEKGREDVHEGKSNAILKMSFNFPLS